MTDCYVESDTCLVANLKMKDIIGRVDHGLGQIRNRGHYVQSGTGSFGFDLKSIFKLSIYGFDSFLF